MPLSKESIQAQLGQLEYRRTFFNGSELRALPGVIRENERMLAVSRCRFENANWLLVATDQRLMLLSKGVLYGGRQLELPLSEIQSIQCRTGMFGGEVAIATASGTRQVEKLRRRGARVIADVVSRVVQAARGRAAGPAGTPDLATNEALLRQLERLAQLRQSGVLNEQEFLAQKQKLLGG